MLKLELPPNSVTTLPALKPIIKFDENNKDKMYPLLTKHIDHENHEFVVESNLPTPVWQGLWRVTIRFT